jgi:hypothetical protein
MTTARDKWRMTLPAVAASWLSFLDVRWWIAGGWALDLFIGAQTRPHADLDIGILRRDVGEVLRHLSSWEFFEAQEGVLTRLRAAQDLRPDVHSLWSRPAAVHAGLDHADGADCRV